MLPGESDVMVVAAANASSEVSEPPPPPEGVPVPVVADGSGSGRVPRLLYSEARARLLVDFEVRYLTDLLTETRGNLSAASRRSGIDRSNLRRMLKRRGLRASAFRSQTSGDGRVEEG